MPGYVFTELLPLDDLLTAETLELVAARDLTVYVAMPPGRAGRADEVVGRFRDAGARVGLWPLLDKADGYWPNVWNAERFAARCAEILEPLERLDLLPDELLVDLEPPFEVAKRILRLRAPRFRRFDPGGADALARLTDEIGSLCPVSAAVAPLVCGPGGRGWQRLLGTPVSDLALSRVFVMAYTSLVEGYGRGALRRRDCEALLARWARNARASFGDRAAIAVGVAGAGALGDERPYRDAGELARDAGIARAGGCEHLALFCLEGVLAQADRDDWLEALAAAPPIAPPPPSPRARALLGSIASVGRIAEALARTSRS